MKYFLKVLLAIFLMAALLSGCQPATDAETLEWNNGWVRAMPPNSGMTAAYGELRNAGKKDVFIISFESDSFTHVSLHQSRNENGMSGMQEVTDAAVAQGQSLLLAPGGLHVMLMQPKRRLKDGETVTIKVHVANMAASQSDQRSATKSYEFVLPVLAK